MVTSYPHENAVDQAYYTILQGLDAHQNMPYRVLVMSALDSIDFYECLNALRPSSPCCILFFYHGSPDGSSMMLLNEQVSVADVLDNIQLRVPLTPWLHLVHFSCCNLGQVLPTLPSLPFTVTGYSGIISMDLAPMYDRLLLQYLAWYGLNVDTLRYIQLCLGVVLLSEQNADNSQTSFTYVLTRSLIAHPWLEPAFELPYHNPGASPLLLWLHQLLSSSPVPVVIDLDSTSSPDDDAMLAQDARDRFRLSHDSSDSDDVGTSHNPFTLDP
jgi:hypothetical protein